MRYDSHTSAIILHCVSVDRSLQDKVRTSSPIGWQCWSILLMTQVTSRPCEMAPELIPLEPFVFRSYMRHTGGFETKVIWATRFVIASMMQQEMREGWELMYIVPPPQMTPPISFQTNSPTNYSTIDPATGVRSEWITIPSMLSSEGQLEIGLIRFNENPPETPCPRCSYPFPDPDRIDRQV